ncbi:MAG TPA: hypothetical protein VLB04_05020 [Methanotrichaceae archaeon]|nr:hypothetical protein [Methanotrichaceae archaeon]
METMGDLLEKVREFASHSFTEDEAQMLFGWEVKDISTRGAKTDESHVIISFDNGMVLYINYFLNLDPTETEDNCEFILALRTDLRSRVKYSVHYSKYIHGQGYIRLKVAETDNRMVQSMIEEYYVPVLKMIYKPIIIQFQGFYDRDYFGVQADNNYSEIYYAPVRYRNEYKNAKIWDVVARLQALDALLREPEIRHALAELDLQLSFLPDVVGSSL